MTLSNSDLENLMKSSTIKPSLSRTSVPLTSTPRTSTKTSVPFEQYMSANNQTRGVLEGNTNSDAHEGLTNPQNMDWMNLLNNSEDSNPLNAAALQNILEQIKKNDPNAIALDLNTQDSTEIVPASNNFQNDLLQKAYGINQPTKSTPLDQAKAIAQKITSLYEGGEVAGNFDGQGLSIGYLQWNIGSGTLQPMLKEMANGTKTKKEFDAIFNELVPYTNVKGQKVTVTMADALRDVLNKSRSEQLAWARSINNSSDHVVEPWRSAFKTLTQNNKFSKIEDQFAKPYLNTATNIMNNEDFGVKTNRGYALAFDIAVQNGSVKASAKKMIKDALSGGNSPLTNPNYSGLTRNQRAVVNTLQERLSGVGDLETRKLYYTAAAVAITSNDRYIQDVWSRKAAIIAGTGKVHGTVHNFNVAVGLNDHAIV